MNFFRFYHQTSNNNFIDDTIYMLYNHDRKADYKNTKNIGDNIDKNLLKECLYKLFPLSKNQ